MNVTAILKAYELVPEAYRQRFRDFRKSDAQTHAEYAREKETLFQRWCNSRSVDGDYTKLKELVLVEEFKRGIHRDIRTYLNEREVVTLHDAAVKADDYALTHKATLNNNKKNVGITKSNTFGGALSKSEKSTKENVNSDSKADKSTSEKSSFSGICWFCNKVGHARAKCKEWIEAGRPSTKPVGHVAVVNESDMVNDMPSSGVELGMQRDNVSDQVRNDYAPFLSVGSVIYEGNANKQTYNVDILRDTGCSQSLMLQNILPDVTITDSTEQVLIKGIEGNYISLPLVQVYLKSDLISGYVKVGLTPSLPMPGITFLLGNDIAGGKVTPQPKMSLTPIIDQDTEKLNDEIPGLFPACIVTRSKSYDMPTVNETLPPGDCTELHEKILHCNDESSDDLITRSQLILAQQCDPSLKRFFEKVISSDEIDLVPVGYYLDKDVLMRKYRAPDVPLDEEWRVQYQIVVPAKYRHHVLMLGHATPMSGHLGVKKTYFRILKHFFWPYIKTDVKRYCKTCTVCQMAGKPNQKPPKAPLKPIPAFNEPFSHLILDCVGPLPRTKSGKQYLLTIMCSSTRFPEAIPLSSIKTTAICNAMNTYFSRFGLARSIQTDQGSNFQSNQFKQFLSEQDIKQVRSTAYHPESQGALERFHQTFKTMLRTYCLEHDKDWDSGVPLLLFAVRDSVHESLGFTPFELIFGHNVRTPLKMLKEKWVDKNEKTDLLSYVRTFKNRLSDACSLAKKCLKTSQETMKTWYDRKAVKRSFQPGDKVLMLSPIPGSVLTAKYVGPYTILKKLNDLNYVIHTPNKRKRKQVCHINMLKKFNERVVAPVDDNDVKATVLPVITEKESNDFEVPESSPRLQNSQVLENFSDKLSHLTADQQSEMLSLVNEYKHLFSDVPGRTTAAVHDIKLLSSTPIKQHPYRTNPEKQAVIDKELAYMLEHEIVEHSNSCWSSPCLLVPKPDGTSRFCTDFRKVYSVTKTDTYPLPRIDDCIDSVGQAQYVSKFDLLKGYWQVPLTDAAKDISAFAVANGLFQYRVLPFGLKNAPPTFQRLMDKVISGLKNTKVYIDDVIVHSKNWADHLKYIRALFDRLPLYQLTVNLSKSDFGKATVIYLGHVVGQGKISPIEAKVQGIAKFVPPNDRKSLRRFLGMAGFYRKFCRNFADVAMPLTNLLKKQTPFNWTDKCQASFDGIKAMLMSSPVLAAPNFAIPFKLAIDASDLGMGAVLIQENSEGVDHPVCYYSKKFNVHQQRYSTIEKEALALLRALDHFEVYVGGYSHSTVVYTDHNPLTFVTKMKNKNQRLLNWCLTLQKYNIKIEHIKGRDNVIADALSRASAET